jgi:hypothetical protein
MQIQPRGLSSAMSEPSRAAEEADTLRPRDVNSVKADEVPTLFDQLSSTPSTVPQSSGHSTFGSSAPPSTSGSMNAVFGKPAAMVAPEEASTSNTGGGLFGSRTFGALGASSIPEGLFGRPAPKQLETDKRIAASQAIE